MDLVVNHVKLPSYLLDLEIPHDDIVLVHGGKHKIDSSKSTGESFGNSSIASNSACHNLTGSPLEVDLSVLPFDVGQSRQLEDSHLPVDLKAARKFINNNNNNNKNTKLSDAIFCVCNGNDSNRTVVLGSHESAGMATGTLIYIKDPLDLTSIKNKLDEFSSVHMENVGTCTSKVDIKTKCTYELHCSKLSADCLLSGLYNGSILIEAIWNSLQFNIPESGVSLKMMLQIVLGHENSIFHPYFEDLLFLQQCFDVLGNEVECQHDTPIEFKFKHKKENVERVSDLLQFLNVIVMPIGVPKSMEEAIQHSENSSFMDKLWNFVKHSKTAGDVKNYFDELFTSIAESPPSHKSQVLDEDDTETVIGKLINNMFSNLSTIPFLSHKQSLEILINLGVYKLKKNYLYVINWCDFTAGEQLQHMWMNDILASTEVQRKTLNILNFAKSFSQYNFIVWIHVILEFLQLIVEYNKTFFDENKVMVLKYACDKYMNNKSWSAKTLRLETKQFFDLSFPLTYDDFSSIYGKLLAKWQVEMISSDKNSSVTTMFHFSKKPIFPSVIYESLCDELTESTSSENTFYFTLLERFSDRIS